MPREAVFSAYRVRTNHHLNVTRGSGGVEPLVHARARSRSNARRGLGTNREPVWTKDLAARGAVFTHPGKCCRSGITYLAPLKRYLWVQILPGSQGPKEDRRFDGGFGVYDAPEPWGPWTTVYFTAKWDIGPGETSSFPTKWMSADGKTLHLVFSGDDCFSVRRASLVLAVD